MSRLVPAWIIDHWRRQERNNRDHHPQPMLPALPLNEPFDTEYDDKKDKKPSRGVVILDMMLGEEIVKSD
jgi:hypothetical protein|tara:strand:+ start:807 stop:1016 length:210 start_codon:yes stop_codon:yes gene_type:complete